MTLCGLRYGMTELISANLLHHIPPHFQNLQHQHLPDGKFRNSYHSIFFGNGNSPLSVRLGGTHTPQQIEKAA